MSTNRAGDIAPLPSPTAVNAPADNYFASLAPNTDQSQQQFPHASQQQQQDRFPSQPRDQSYPPQQAPQSHAPGPGHMQHMQQQDQSYYDGRHTQAQQQPSAQSSTLPSNQAHQQQIPQYSYAPYPPEEEHRAPTIRQLSNSSTESEASVHLRDFSLIAEAAKRAQIAVVARDLEEVSL